MKVNEKFNSIKDAIMKIITTNQKEIIGKFNGIIKDMLLLYNDRIIIEIEDEFAIYQGFTLIKSEIFPTPKKGDFLEFNKIILKLDEEDGFKLRFFIYNFNKNPLKTPLIIKEKEILNFRLINIISQLKILLDIKEELKISIFYLIKKEKKKIYLKSLNNFEEYIIGDFFLQTIALGAVSNTASEHDYLVVGIFR